MYPVSLARPHKDGLGGHLPLPGTPDTRSKHSPSGELVISQSLLWPKPCHTLSTVPEVTGAAVGQPSALSVQLPLPFPPRTAPACDLTDRDAADEDTET